MAGYLNKVQIIGNLGKDPEIRSMQNGGRVANLSVATTVCSCPHATRVAFFFCSALILRGIFWFLVSP